MSTLCRKCGAEKTENVHHGLLYGLAKALGYRLRMCSRCHRLRLIPLQGERAGKTPTDKPAPQPEVRVVCPKCGKTDSRRSRRQIWERLILRGPMARCRACQARFPMPRPADGQD